MDLFWRRSRTSPSIISYQLGRNSSQYRLDLSACPETLWHCRCPAYFHPQASVPALAVCLTFSLGLPKPLLGGFHAFRKYFSNPVSSLVAPVFFKVESNYSPHNPFCTGIQPCGTLKSHVKFWISNYSIWLCSLFLTKTHLLGSMTLFPKSFEPLNIN